MTVVDNLRRRGSADNLAWLNASGSLDFIHADVRVANDLDRALSAARPDVVFHLAEQVAMTTSIEDPRLDFEINALGSFNLLQAVQRHAPSAVVVYASTNKVYGDLERYDYEETPTRWRVPSLPNGFDEQTPLDLRSPYGCSKGSADQYMLDAYRTFGLRTIVFRHSSVFGDRQFSTFDQGWVGWFVKQALKARAGHAEEAFTINGDGKQVRDLLFASDLVRCYFGAVEHADRCVGEAFNIGGGMHNSLSLLELFATLEERLDVRLQYRALPPRASDQRVFVADLRKATAAFGWSPQVDRETGIDRMIRWVEENDRG